MAKAGHWGHGLETFSCKPWCSHIPRSIHTVHDLLYSTWYLPQVRNTTSVRIGSLAQGQSSNCSIASEATLKNIDKQLTRIHYELVSKLQQNKANKTMWTFCGIHCGYLMGYALCLISSEAALMNGHVTLPYDHVCSPCE